MWNSLNPDEVNQYIISDGYKVIKGYEKATERMMLICPKGHEVEMYWSSFKKGHRCKKCGREVVARKLKLNHEHVLNFLNEIGYKMLDDIYINAKTKINVQCSNGHIYKTTFDSIKRGQRCSRCNQKHILYTYDEVFEIIKSLGLELLSKNYTDAHKKLKIKCRCGKIFYKNLNKIKYEPRCPQCGEEERAKKRSLGLEYIKKYISNEGYKLLSKEYKNVETKLLIECEKGHKYKTTFDKFRGGSRCITCSNSFGERKIEKYLEKTKIKYEKQFKFCNCKNKRELPFDFAVFDENNKLNFVIEYNGRQHYEPVDYFGGEKQFKIQLNNDSIKVRYCEENNINLIVIPYWDHNNIEEILNDIL